MFRWLLKLIGITEKPAEAPRPRPSVEWRRVKASSFADPADVRAFKKCKDQGKSDQECFKVGDNGIGFTGLPCWRDDVPYVALPREIWLNRFGNKASASGAKVLIRFRGVVFQAQLGDTMPSLKNIKNGAGIDLNPGCAKIMGIKPPFMVEVEWAWG